MFTCTLHAAVTLVLLVSLPFVTGTGTIVCTNNEIVNFNLIDTSVTPPIVTDLTPVVDLSDFSTCKLNIEATIDSTPSNCDERTVKCVQFFFDGIPVRKEKFALFTLYGDVTGGAINSRKPKLGNHTVKACTYSEKACTKNEMGCKEMEVNFLGCGRTTERPFTAPVRSPVKAPVKVPVGAPIRPAPVSSALSVACNFLETPDITACQSITRFSPTVVLGNTIPIELGLLTQITYLDLGGRQLHSTIPSTMGQLTKLKYLDLSLNQLTGTIPSILGQLKKLTYLNLGVNALTGTIPSTLGKLMQLTKLGLSVNQLTGTIPSTLGQLTQLNSLGLSLNQLTSTIPSVLGLLTQLNGLGLYDNQLTGTVPSILGQLTQLSSFVLYNNTQLTGTIPSTLCSRVGISIGIDCANIVCTCCYDGSTGTSCLV